jgi:eukaryotic-like serine/threonine-protein kinase
VPERFGAYTIHEELGAGGMASVHLADWRPHSGVPRRVALKRLYPHVAENPELVSMFIDEARLARYLSHPNIAQVYELGRIGGIYFIAFEFVPGPTVKQLMEQCDKHVGYIPIPVVIEIICQLCDALHHAHNLCDEEGLPLGIVHRDISPQNLIVSTVGFVKLIDFGLAKAKQSSHESVVGVLKGKLSYIAPEYLEGQLDIRCDLWAVGVVLHELLSGRRLFDGNDNLKVLEHVQSGPIPPPSRFRAEVRSELDNIVFQALERDPQKRWQTAAALRAALAAHAREYPPLTKSQLVSWVEWAFGQTTKVREDSGIAALHSIQSAPAISLNGLDDAASVAQKLPATQAAMDERRRESLAAMPVGAAMLRAHEQEASKWPWIVLGLLLLVLGFLLAVLLF